MGLDKEIKFRMLYLIFDYQFSHINTCFITD